MREGGREGVRGWVSEGGREEGKGGRGGRGGWEGVDKHARVEVGKVFYLERYSKLS